MSCIILSSDCGCGTEVPGVYEGFVRFPSYIPEFSFILLCVDPSIDPFNFTPTCLVVLWPRYYVTNYDFCSGVFMMDSSDDLRNVPGDVIYCFSLNVICTDTY